MRAQGSCGFESVVMHQVGFAGAFPCRVRFVVCFCRRRPGPLAQRSVVPSGMVARRRPVRCSCMSAPSVTPVRMHIFPGALVIAD